MRQGATYLEDENTIAVRGLSEAEVRPRARGLSQIGKKIACSRVHSTGADLLANPRLPELSMDGGVTLPGRGHEQRHGHCTTGRSNGSGALRRGLYRQDDHLPNRKTCRSHLLRRLRVPEQMMSPVVHTELINIK